MSDKRTWAEYISDWGTLKITFTNGAYIKFPLYSACLAAFLSYYVNKSIWYAILHGLLNWIYIIWWIVFHSGILPKFGL
jgi:hypothetical protein